MDQENKKKKADFSKENLFKIWQKLKKTFSSFRNLFSWQKFKGMILQLRGIKFEQVKVFAKRNYPLILAILLLAPTFILLFLFVNSRIHKQGSYAAPFTGTVLVSKQSTAFSTAAGWLKSLAFSGDGRNGEADYFQPVHPRAANSDAIPIAAGLDSLSTVTANNYDAIGGHFIPWQPSANGDIYGVLLNLYYSGTADFFNGNVVVELLSFPSANYTGVPPAGSWDAGTYVSCTAITTCSYPADTVIERRVIMRWDQIMNTSAAPGAFGQTYVDFRFDPVFTADTTKHYGFRVYYNNLITVAGWPRNGATKPLLNAANFGLGVLDVDTANASTVTIPMANTTASSYMVALNSAAINGQAVVARTQNEHWSGTYSSGDGNWTITGSVSGAQTVKLTSATTGGTGTSWVDDGSLLTTLSDDATVSTKLCVNSITGFARDQIIDIWDSDTVSISRTIASTDGADGACSSGKSITVTAALAATDTFTVSKNATVARANWKLRIIQGAEEAITQVIDNTHFCVADASQFTVNASASNVNIWDDDSVIAVRRVTAIQPDTGCTVPTDDQITVNSSLAGAYTVAKNARVAEISANFSNLGTPSDGDVFRFTTINMGQNPTKTGTVGSMYIRYGKTIAPATTATATRYPYIINIRHPFYIAYGDDGAVAAPVDGDMVVVGGGAVDPDINDSPNLSNDTLFGTTSPHAVTVDKNFEMPLVYTGNAGGGYADGTITAATAPTGTAGSGFVSMLLSTNSTLTADTSANKHYRLVAPGKIVLGSGATLNLGYSSFPFPQTSTVDLYQDSSGPNVFTTLAADLSAAATSATLTSVTGFYIGDVVQIKDDDTAPITVLIASINTSTKVITFAATISNYTHVASVPSGYAYTMAKNAIVSRGPDTDRPTGGMTRSYIYNSGLLAARENVNTEGVDSYRIPQADLAVDIDGNIDTGYLAGNQISAGNTWLDVTSSLADTLAGNWNALDPLSVAQGTNQGVNNWDSSIGMGSTYPNSNAMPTWAGGMSAGTVALGYNGDPTYNMELSEIGTIPLTNIYNVDYNGGGALGFSSNYNTSSSWTIFGDNANTEVDDAVYFGDQGNTPIYALEFNIKTAMSADVSRVWEYYNGSTWASFTPALAWKFEPRGTDNAGVGEYCIPFNSNPTYPASAVSVTDANTTYTYFAVGQYAKIKDSGSPTIIRRITAVTSGTPGTITFSEIIPDVYTTGENAQICVPIGGRWVQTDPTDLFATTGRFLISWNSWDTSTPAKTDIGNGMSAYYVRNRISVFNSWTTSPENQTTAVGMQGVENENSHPLTVSNSVAEAKLSNISTGASFDPNETWVLRYNDNSTSLPAKNLKTDRWYESQITPYGTAHRWASVNPDGESSAYYEKNSQEGDWRTFNGDFSWTDYSVYAKVYMNQIMSGTRRMGILLRQDADDYGYGILITPNATPANSSIRWYTTAYGAETAIGTATTITFNPNQWYCLRAEANGTTLQAKFWSPVSEDADCNGDANEPVGWTESEVGQTAFTTGRFGLSGDTMLARFDDVTVKSTDGSETWFNDNFNDTGCWKVISSIHGSQGCAYNSTPFTSNYINFTIKHKGGVQSGETGANAVIGPLNAPEEGDEIYLSPLMKGSNIGLDETKGIDTDDDETKYENWDFTYNSDDAKWDVAGSQYGSAGQATPNTTYTSPGGEVSLKIKSDTPTAPKFGDRAAYFQNSMQRSTGNFTGLNNKNSAVIISPYWALNGSATQYNIEGTSGAITNTGTIDFWFKPNFSDRPDYIQYLFDWANQNSASERIAVRIVPMGASSNIEAFVYGGTARGTVLTKTFSPVAGQWYHFRLAWEDSDGSQLNKKYAYLDGSAFTNNGTAVGARASNAGMIRLGNSWQYNAGFDGAIDEFAVFDNAVDTSAGDNWGDFTPPVSAWTNGQTVGTLTNIGNIIFLTHFDDEIEKQKGFTWADYFIGHPLIVFTNGADNFAADRIRVVTYPKRNKIWIDNTGSQYTPSARIKFSDGYLVGTEVGWGTTFQYHHRAYSENADHPITSPVLNLRKQIRIWSDEDYLAANASTPINEGYGMYLQYAKNVNIKHLEMSQLYDGIYINGNPTSGASTFPTQYFQNNSFNNLFAYAIAIASKVQGNQVIDSNNFASNGNGSYGFYETASSNSTLSDNFLTGFTTGYLSRFNGGRNFTVSGNKFLNFSFPIYMDAGTAKMTIADNEFWRFIRGLSLAGNAYITLSNNTYDGGIYSTANNGLYGSGIGVLAGTTNVGITDSGSKFGRSIWNEADISMWEDTGSYLAGSLLNYIAEDTELNSNFQYLGLPSQDKFGNEYIATAIPGVDVRLSEDKDVVNFTNFGIMRTTGTGLNDTLVRTAGGYGWRMESTSETDPLEYSAKVVGVSGKPLAVTGYLRINDTYGNTDLPTVTLSGLGMTGDGLTWTASNTSGTWQQFTVSGTPTESALATVKFSVKSNPIAADSGTAENVDDAQGNVLPTVIEDTDKNWIWNQWAGYKVRDDQGFIFDVIGNTANRLFLKGSRIPFGNILPTQPYGSTYKIFSPPYVYLDDISVLSGTVDTGTLDFYSDGQPVSTWLSTGLTADDVWSAQYSLYSDTAGSFGKLLQDTLLVKYGTVSDTDPTTTTFGTSFSDTLNIYGDEVLIFTNGNNKGASRRITNYKTITKEITVDPALPSVPGDGDEFVVVPNFVYDVWKTSAAGLTAAGSIGEQLATNVDTTISSRASQISVDAMAADVISILTEIGTGNISAIKTATDTINWSDITGLVTTSGEIKAKTDTIDWTNITAIKTKTDTIDWSDINQIELKTNTINWGDITDIKSDVATLITEIGTGNISAIKTATDTINWSDITGLVTTSGEIKAKTDTIDWTNITAIKTKTDTIEWNDVTGIKLKTDTIDWSDISTISSRVDTTVSSRASQSSVDTYQTANATALSNISTGISNLAIDIATVQSDLSNIDTKIDTLATTLNAIDTKIDTLDIDTSGIKTTVDDIADDLEDVTNKIGKVSPESFAQHFEVKQSDIDYLENKIIELKAISEIDRQLIEKTINEPIVKVLMEWGSVVMKFIVVNPSDSTDQKIPFKAYLPKEVRQEYIMDLGGLALNYDATTEQYYVTADIYLKAGESVTRSIEIKDIWTISEDEINSLRKQSEEMASGLTDTSYNAQAITLKTDINTRLDKILRKQKDSNATPQDHILAYRENQEELKAINEDMKGMKDLVLNSGVGKSFLASVGGIQAFATWGIVLALIFGMGALGFFYYALWRRKIISMDAIEEDEKEKIKTTKRNSRKKTSAAPLEFKKDNQNIELPTPSPLEMATLNFSWIKKIGLGLLLLLKDIASIIKKISAIPKRILAAIVIIVIITSGIFAFIKYENYKKEKVNKENEAAALIEEQNQIENEKSEEKRKLLDVVAEINKQNQKEKEVNKIVDDLLESNKKAIINTSEETAEATVAETRIIIKDTPTGWLNVRELPLISSSIVAKVYSGEKYAFSEITDGWYKVTLDNLDTGWVNGEYVEEESKISAGNYSGTEEKVLGVSVDTNHFIAIKQNNFNSANVYKNPAYLEKIITRVYPGEIYPLLERKDGWYKIILKDQSEGWILGKYLKEENQKELKCGNDLIVEVMN